jgi:hypothetical protein
VDRRCLPNAESDLDKIKQQLAEDMAVSVLWALTGRQFGVCPVIARPCPTPCSGVLHSWYNGPGWYPVWDDGQWRNITCGCPGSQCQASGPGVVHLPGPAVEVTEVKLGGTVLGPSEYALQGGYLYRTGGGKWPDQDLSRPLDEDGTWSVTYTKGIPVPPGVGVLVGTLALEFLNACTGGKCKLPRRVQTVSRQGVTMTMVDPTDIYDEGITGIPEIDLFIKSVNPHKLLARPTVR